MFDKICNWSQLYDLQFLLRNENLYSELMERGFGRSSRIVITVLEYLRPPENRKLAEKKFFRRIMKELNLQLGFRRISLLPHKELYGLIEEITEEVKANPNAGAEKEDK